VRSAGRPMAVIIHRRGRRMQPNDPRGESPPSRTRSPTPTRPQALAPRTPAHRSRKVAMGGLGFRSPSKGGARSSLPLALWRDRRRTRPRRRRPRSRSRASTRCRICSCGRSISTPFAKSLARQLPDPPPAFDRRLSVGRRQFRSVGFVDRSPEAFRALAAGEEAGLGEVKGRHCVTRCTTARTGYVRAGPRSRWQLPKYL
jgi:hypothetical protein